MEIHGIDVDPSETCPRCHSAVTGGEMCDECLAAAEAVLS